MQIGLLTSFFALGDNADSGIGQHYRILADALAGQGHRVHVVHPTLQPERASRALAALAPRWSCDVVPVAPPAWLGRLFARSWPSQVLLGELATAQAASRALAGAVRTHGLEIIETHATGAPALFYLQRRNRPPVVTRVSTTLSQMNAVSTVRSRVKGWQVALERRAVRKSDALVTHTARHRDAICLSDGFDPRAFTLVPHGLPDLPLPPSAPVSKKTELLFVGRFEDRKGIDVLLDALPAVLAAHPEVHVTLAGSTGDGLLWKKFTQAHPDLAGSRVVSLGIVSPEKLQSLYIECDLLVAPSRYESFGLIYVEAMRCAKPVVGCNAGGIPEVVTDGVTGLLCPPGDVAGLTACLLRLASDRTLRERLGRAGREDFLRRFSAAELARASVNCYRRVLAS